MLGTEKLYLCHLPMYHVPAHSFQTILEAEIDTPEMEKYLKLKKENPNKPVILFNESEMILEELAHLSSFVGPIHFADINGDPDGDPIGQTKVNITKILLSNKLNENSPDYPNHLEYYLFGTNSDCYLSHVLSKAPNFEQELGISISGTLLDNKESHLIKVSIPSVDEKNKQHITNDPLTQNEYTIETDKKDKFQISITNRYWINNTMLNPRKKPTTHIGH
jgi:hypothetical protein